MEYTVITIHTEHQDSLVRFIDRGCISPLDLECHTMVPCLDMDIHGTMEICTVGITTPIDLDSMIRLWLITMVMVMDTATMAITTTVTPMCTATMLITANDPFIITVPERVVAQ